MQYHLFALSSSALVSHTDPLVQEPVAHMRQIAFQSWQYHGASGIDDSHACTCPLFGFCAERAPIDPCRRLWQT